MSRLGSPSGQLLSAPLLIMCACALGPRTVEPGHRVRVERVEGDTVVGSVLEANADSLIVSRSAAEVVGMSTGSVRSVEVDLRSARPWHRPVQCAFAGLFAIGTGMGASDEGLSPRVVVLGILGALHAWECVDGRSEWRRARVESEDPRPQAEG